MLTGFEHARADVGGAGPGRGPEASVRGGGGVGGVVPESGPEAFGSRRRWRHVLHRTAERGSAAATANANPLPERAIPISIQISKRRINPPQHLPLRGFVQPVECRIRQQPFHICHGYCAFSPPYFLTNSSTGLPIGASSGIALPGRPPIPFPLASLILFNDCSVR